MADLRDGLLYAVIASLQAGSPLVVFAPVDCCAGRIADGPAGCTCWQPIYDREQIEPTDETVARVVCGEQQPEVRKRMCADCAYRPGSPEKQGAETAAVDASDLERLAREDRFWCHDEMRSPVAWQHPSGPRIPADPERTGDYQPPIVCGVPYRANGQPGLLCAGWAARRRALTNKRGDAP